MQNATVERKALTDYLKRCMKYPNPGLMPFGAEKDDNGNWKFTDVKPEDVPAIDAFIEAVEATLVGDGKITLTGFGTFLVDERKARTGRNPRTGAEINIPASKVVKFRPGKLLKDSIQ